MPWIWEFWVLWLPLYTEKNELLKCQVMCQGLLRVINYCILSKWLTCHFCWALNRKTNKACNRIQIFLQSSRKTTAFSASHRNQGNLSSLCERYCFILYGHTWHIQVLLAFLGWAVRMRVCIHITQHTHTMHTPWWYVPVCHTVYSQKWQLVISTSLSLPPMYIL